MTFTYDNVTEVSPHHFVTEGSDLGWPPHVFPVTVPTALGNKLPSHLISLDAGRAVYRQQFGCVEITVYND